jgi:hypothetical protein
MLVYKHTKQSDDAASCVKRAVSANIKRAVSANMKLSNRRNESAAHRTPRTLTAGMLPACQGESEMLTQRRWRWLT